MRALESMAAPGSEQSAFDDAVKFITAPPETLARPTDNAEKLLFYGLFKQATKVWRHPFSHGSQHPHDMHFSG
jgi:hypothetical protein